MSNDQDSEHPARRGRRSTPTGTMMTLMPNLLDDLVARPDQLFLASERPFEVVEGHDCHGCGVGTPDVDLWAEDTETGEELWLCEACGDW
jgi:hypothetical protein